MSTPAPTPSPSLSIRTRLTLIYTGVLFLTLIVFGITGAWVLHARMIDRTNTVLTLRLEGLEGFLQRETDPGDAPRRIADEALEYALTQPEGHLVDLQDESGQVLLRSEPVHGPVARRAHRFTLHDRRYDASASASLEPIDVAQRELLRLLWVSGPLLLAVSAISGYWLSRRAFAPVDAMTRTARTIGLTDLGQRVPVPPTRDELARLAEAWNEMLGRLEASVSQVRRFTADAAHELRTPLSVLRTTAELSLRKPRDAAEYREALAEVVTASERLTSLVEGLLTLARGDAGAIGPARAPVDVPALARGVSRDLARLFEARGVSLDLRMPDSAPATGWPDRTDASASATRPSSSTPAPASVRRSAPPLAASAAPVDPDGNRVAVEDADADADSHAAPAPAQEAPPMQAGALTVPGDAAALRRLLVALLENAAQHTPAGGRVTVTVSGAAGTSHVAMSSRMPGTSGVANNIAAPGLSAAGASGSKTSAADAAPVPTPDAGGAIAVSDARAMRDAFVVIEVRDTGPGISARHLARIFDRFYRADAARGREAGGHGLGLAIAQQVARAHGGEITVDSPPGEGACFRVTLPAAASRLQPQP